MSALTWPEVVAYAVTVAALLFVLWLWTRQRAIRAVEKQNRLAGELAELSGRLGQLELTMGLNGPPG